ncbi:MAG: ATPase, T2SS/T4P/T4SS family [Candidatus Brocadiia bacterium]
MESRKRLGEILLDFDYISERQLQEALQRQQREMSGKKLGEILIDSGFCGDAEITRALAEQFNLEIVFIEDLKLNKAIVEKVPAELAREQNIIPVDFSSGVLTVAMGDPLDLDSLDKIGFVVNSQVECVLANPSGIKDALANYYGIEEKELIEKMKANASAGLEITERDFEDIDIKEGEQDDAPIIRYVTGVIADAMKARASDIHVECLADRIRIRYRVDGYCYEAKSAPKRLQGPITSRIKIMAGMDIAERRKPQDGRIKIKLLNREIDIRVSDLPATQGESIVMRILDKETLLLGLEQLGFHQSDFEIFNKLIRRPNGIILVTGPTGSGKTTTLYAALNVLNRPDRKIITAENPVEYHLDGINQCNVHPKIGFTFTRIIRAMMRQAPNIILVGEIRDLETAEIAIQAALTGHLVFSTLHTNDAPSAITRLIDIGLKPFLVSSSIQAVMAQRLVRKVCPDCREQYEPEYAKLIAIGMTKREIEQATFFHGRGCRSCKQTGYRGRIGVFELMVMNTKIREMAFRKTTTDQIREQAIADGMHTLIRDGIRKVTSGVTTVDEILSAARTAE